MTDEVESPRVQFSELDYDGELIYTLGGHPFTGIAYEEVPGKWRSELSYRDGMQEGIARDWYDSGVLKEDSYFRENVRHGPWKSYDSDGTLASEEFYEYGIHVSRRTYSSDGEIVDSWAISPASSTYRLLEKYRREKHWDLPGNKK
jgi:antitoxin component YwqK of YwqJK toxin-antitoxin module